MKCSQDRKILVERFALCSFVFMLAQSAHAGCSEYSSESQPDPLVEICDGATCIVTRVSYVCTNVVETLVGYENGMRTECRLQPNDGFACKMTSRFERITCREFAVAGSCGTLRPPQ